jgi:hypothetical protein
MSKVRGADFAISFVTLGAAMTWFVLVTFVVGAIAWGVFSVELGMVPHPRLSITAIFAGSTACVLAIHGSVGRWHEGRAPLLVALSMLGWFPFLFAIGDHEIGAILAAGPSWEGSAKVDPTASDSLLPAAAFALFALGPIASAIAAPYLARAYENGGVAFSIAIAAWIIGLLFVGAGVSRAHRLPDPDTYFARLPVVAAPKEDDHVFLDGADVLYTQRNITATSYYGCHLEIGLHVVVGPQLPCHEITIVRDDANQIFIVEGGEHGAGLRMGTLEHIAVHPSTVSKSLAPPLGWVIGALAGVFFAIFPLVTAYILGRRNAGIRAAGASVTAAAIVAITCATVVAAGLQGI